MIGDLVLAILRFAKELFKHRDETATTATEHNNPDDRDRFREWVRSRSETPDSGGESERVPPSGGH